MKRCATTAAVAMLGVIVLRSLLLTVEHNWDLEAFLYLGSRLAHGELLYEKDFETKLPIVQYIFFVPYRLGGIGAWRIISFLLVSLAYVLGTTMVIGRGRRLSSDGWHRVVTTSAVVLILGNLLRGAESAPIAMLAGAFLFVSMVLLHVGLARMKGAAPTFVAAGITAAVAVSIRPNYIYALPGLVLVSPIDRLLTRGRRDPASMLREVVAFLAGFAGMAGLQCVPYLLHQGGVAALAGGLGALARFSMERPFTANLEAQVSFLPLLALIAASYAWLFVRLRAVPPGDDESSRHMLAGCLGAVLAMAGLEFQMVAHHCWPHYCHLFLPFLALAAAYGATILAVPAGRVSRVSSPLERMLVLSLIAALGLEVTHVAFREARDFAAFGGRQRLSWRINDRLGDPTLKEFLRLAKAGGMSFYAPYDANCHWQLDEARIGDGHPAMFMAVMDGSFRTPVGGIPLYSDEVRRAPCLLFARSGKDLVVVPRHDASRVADDLIRCLADARIEVEPAAVIGGLGMEPAMIDHLAATYRFFLSRDAAPAGR